MEELDVSKVRFIDEAGSHTAMTRLYGRSKRGERCHGQAPRNRGNVLTMIGALSLEHGLPAMMTLEGGTDTDVFVTYVEQVLGPTLRPGDIVVLDTLGAHRTRAARDAIHAAGAKVKSLPPYSPDLNPIEMTWSKVKEWLRAATPRSRRDIDEELREVMKAVTTDDARGWIGACGYLGPFG